MENKKQRVFNKVYLKIKQAKKIVLISHRNPDGDTIGSSTGLFESLKKSFPDKKIEIFCIDKIPKKLSFIPNSSFIKDSFELKINSLYIFLDIASIKQSGLDKDYYKLFDKSIYNTISIDHHQTNDLFAKQNIVLTNYASATMIVYDLIKTTGLIINKEVASSLLTGLMTDTGGFMHSNTDEKVLYFASELLSYGADIHRIINRFFKNNKLETIKLWGKVINSSFIDKDNVLYSYINKSDLDSYGVDYEDISGVIDYLNMVDGIKYSATLTQKGEYVKGSLRTLRDDVDLTKIAGKYGGGGHKKASGFTFQGIINEIKNLTF